MDFKFNTEISMRCAMHNCGAQHIGIDISLESFENPVLLYKSLFKMRPLSTDRAILTTCVL